MAARAVLGTDQIVVWYCRTTTLASSALTELEALLSPEEQVRRDRFAFSDDRRDFTVAHGMLRQVLSRYGDPAPGAWRFQSDAFGKPAIVSAQAGSPALTFNLTHTRGLVACAVARGTAVGIDAERFDARLASPDVAASCFAPGELRLLESCAGDQYAARFLELWTLKEAYVKAVGDGLSIPLQGFSFSFESSHRLGFAGPDDHAAWQFVLTAPSADTRLSVAVRRQPDATNGPVTFSEYPHGTSEGPAQLRSSCVGPEAVTTRDV